MKAMAFPPMSDHGHSAIVVGGGIGGLATAIGLHRIGWTVTILERAPAIAEVGAGLSLWPNAIRALDTLGVGPQVAAHGVTAISRGNMRTPAGRWLRRAHPGDTGVLVMHRAELHEVLRHALPEGSLRTNATVTGVSEMPDGVSVRYDFPGGDRQVTAPLVVAADGIESTVRRLLWPQPVRTSFQGRTVWRGITEPGEVGLTQESITLGRGEQFGLLPLTDRRVYWFLTADTDHRGRRYDDELGEVRRRVGHWHDPIPAVLAATPSEHVLHHDVVDLDPMPTYTRGRAVLLGDAAHAMTPDLGQGACQAIEDAVVLASRLATETNLATALARYDQDRRGRTQQIAQAARQSNERNKAHGPARYELTALVMRLAPAGLWRRLTARWTDWTPPPLPQ